jgi:Holliday junction resolvase
MLKIGKRKEIEFSKFFKKMTESKIQSKRIKQLEEDGWYVIKLTVTNKNGIPDLIAIKPNEVLFIECKTEKGKLSKLQEYRIKELIKYGFTTEIYRGEQ